MNPEINYTRPLGEFQPSIIFIKKVKRPCAKVYKDTRCVDPLCQDTHFGEIEWRTCFCKYGDDCKPGLQLCSGIHNKDIDGHLPCGCLLLNYHHNRLKEHAKVFCAQHRLTFSSIDTNTSI